MRYQPSWTVLADPGTSLSQRCSKAASRAFWTRRRGTSDEMTRSSHFKRTNNRHTLSYETRLQTAHLRPWTEARRGQAAATSLPT